MKTGVEKLVVLLLGSLLYTGCAPSDETASTEEEALPKTLSSLQGEWVSMDAAPSNQNAYVVIDRYSIRIRYQEGPDERLVRESAVINHVDEANQFLVINDGLAAWNYSLMKEDGAERLELEFYSKSLEDGWRTLLLERNKEG